MTKRQRNHCPDQLNYVKAVSTANLVLYIFPTRDIYYWFLIKVELIYNMTQSTH